MAASRGEAHDSVNLERHIHGRSSRVGLPLKECRVSKQRPREEGMRFTQCALLCDHLRERAYLKLSTGRARGYSRPPVHFLHHDVRALKWEWIEGVGLA